MTAILTLPEYKTARGITSNTYDNQLEAIIEMVNDYIESYCNREFGEGVFTERREGIVDYTGKFLFYTKNKPINSVAAISVRFFGTDVPLAVDVTKLDIFSKSGYCYYSWMFDPSIAVIRPEYRNQFYYDITYSGGKPVPKAVTLAAITAVGDVFRSYQESTASGGETPTGNLKSMKIGDYSETYETNDTIFKNTHSATTGLILTKTVADLLQPYRLQDQSW